MTKEKQTVWTGKNGRELLVQKKEGEWYVPLSSINSETLIELSEATADAAGEIKGEKAKAE